MPSRARILLLLAVALCLGLASAADKKNQKPEPDVGRFFENRLIRLELPTAGFLRERGLPQVFLGAGMDRTWDAAIKALIQDGIIVYASKRQGIVVAVTDMITRGPQEPKGSVLGAATPLCNTVNILVEPVDNATSRVYLKSDRPLNKVFFDRLAVQLYARTRWKYLSQDQ